METFEQDPLEYAGTITIHDPFLKKEVVLATDPDFCFLRLEKDNILQKYFIPHPRQNILK